ncbi:hypothetical protein [Nocardia sp. BMG111209]|uniref:hypothetical protein n=1 Tax=Nocardia sp. BMG111209 TaxID=1160137 RepID=UPI0018CAF649|nr:hypothetical protein [Nocardia sp. BMG111209]
MTYRYRNLTHALEDPASPLRAHFHQRFPNVRPVQDGYRQASGPIAVDTVTANPGTVGAAFDLLLRFRLDPGYRPRDAAAAEPIASVARHVATVYDVSAKAGAAVGQSPADDSLAVAVRACWALALTTELYRNPLLLLGSLPADLIRAGDFTTEALLALAPDDAVELVGSLYTRAATELGEILTGAHDTVALGATFAASQSCPGDADIIVDGMLIDVKTRLGNRNKRSGVRSDSLPRNDIYQLIGYALFDHVDEYRLTDVAVYSARFATLHRWPLQELLDTVAGEPVDLATERAAVRTLLGAPAADPGPSVEPQPATVSAPDAVSAPSDIATSDAAEPESGTVSSAPDTVTADAAEPESDSDSAPSDTDAAEPESGIVSPPPGTAAATPAERRAWGRFTQWSSRVVRLGRRRRTPGDR